MKSLSAREAAILWQIRQFTLKLHRWRDEIDADTARIKAGFNPNQPRVPPGNPDGGQWSDTGGGGRFGTGRIPRGNLLLRPVMTRKPPHSQRPEDVLEGGAGRGAGGGYTTRPTFRSPTTPKSPEANAAVPKIRQLDRRGADDLQEVMQSRAQGRVSSKETNPQIRDAADDIEKFLGGKVDPADIKPSKSGDLVILKGDKKFRMDVKNPGKLKDGKTPDKPHFHFQRMDEKGDWYDASDAHRNYFKKD